MVMDDLTAHKGSRVRELIEARGCEVLYLPPHAPGLNPIEEAFLRALRLPPNGATAMHAPHRGGC